MSFLSPIIGSVANAAIALRPKHWRYAYGTYGLMFLLVSGVLAYGEWQYGWVLPDYAKEIPVALAVFCGAWVGIRTYLFGTPDE